MKNKVQLITYVDRLSGGNLKDLNDLLLGRLNGLFGGIHLLPFFTPIDGADAGFDPIDHTEVDPRLGSWEDIKEISQHTPIMADLIVNHISSHSPEFKDYVENGDRSRFKDLFLTSDHVFDRDDLDVLAKKIYRPRPTSPFTPIPLKNGQIKNFWTTFSQEQIDINVYSQEGQAYLQDILFNYKEVGVKMIRLDAVGYAIKKAGTTCFMIPETYQFISELSDLAHNLDIKVLVEIHSYYKDQIKIAQHVDYVYDFALPPLILHAIYRRTGKAISDWLKVRPDNCITVLDTHDGIGIIDIGPHQKDPSQTGFISNDEIDFLVREMHRRTNNQSNKATGNAATNFDLYQVNSTYYDVLGRDDNLYILARAIQFFSPGIPQVYYMGLTTEENDMQLLCDTNVGRDINRHYYGKGEFSQALERPGAKKLIELIHLRNSHPGFDGKFSHAFEDNVLAMTWNNGKDQIKLKIDFSDLTFEIK